MSVGVLMVNWEINSSATHYTNIRLGKSSSKTWNGAANVKSDVGNASKKMVIEWTLVKNS